MVKPWPPFICTSNRTTLVYYQDVFFTLHEGLGSYYGVTWNDDKLFLLMREAKTNKNRDLLLVFDKQFKIITQRPMSSYYNSHQIVLWDNKLFVTKTNSNQIEVFSLTSPCKQYINIGPVRADVNHINGLAIFPSEKVLLVGCSNVGSTRKSVWKKYSLENYRYLGEFNAGLCAHNFREGFVTSSYDGYLITPSGERLSFGPWLRGLTMDDNYILVGKSCWSGRSKRGFPNPGECFLLDRRSYKTLDKISVNEIGQINDLFFLSDKGNFWNKAIDSLTNFPAHTAGFKRLSVSK
jgi:hypothetical protein